MSKTLPKIIALCGHPKSGKSLMAELLSKEFGYTIEDDGRFLRDIAIQNFGLTEEDVATQEGKAKKITVNGAEMTVRELLGRLGNAFEDEFGADVIPEIALRRANLKGDRKAVFSSVRREQGAYYKAAGGVVWKIDSPAPASPYEFDQFNEDHVDLTINNPGAGTPDSMNALRSEMGRIIAIS